MGIHDIYIYISWESYRFFSNSQAMATRTRRSDGKGSVVVAQERRFKVHKASTFVSREKYEKVLEKCL